MRFDATVEMLQEFNASGVNVHVKVKHINSHTYIVQPSTILCN